MNSFKEYEPYLFYHLRIMKQLPFDFHILIIKLCSSFKMKHCVQSHGCACDRLFSSASVILADPLAYTNVTSYNLELSIPSGDSGKILPIILMILRIYTLMFISFFKAAYVWLLALTIQCGAETKHKWGISYIYILNQ